MPPKLIPAGPGALGGGCLPESVLLVMKLTPMKLRIKFCNRCCIENFCQGRRRRHRRRPLRQQCTSAAPASAAHTLIPWSGSARSRSTARGGNGVLPPLLPSLSLPLIFSLSCRSNRAPSASPFACRSSPPRERKVKGRRRRRSGEQGRRGGGGNAGEGRRGGERGSRGAEGLVVRGCEGLVDEQQENVSH